MSKIPYTVVLLVPTGIGASIGGYAGDALPIARAIAGLGDRLITHPNVLNGAQLYWSQPNIYYVEGYALDQFALKRWGLRPVKQNSIGLILDQGMELELRLRHLQAADALRATLGLEIKEYILTDAPLGVELRSAPSGASWGTISNPGSLLRAAAKLIDQAKVDAIAVVARFPDEIDSPLLANYRQGSGVDPIAGAEAVISHLIVRTFAVPAAHAPALKPLPIEPQLSPKAAAEELGYTFLPCVLVGLSQAPRIITNQQRYTPDSIWAEQVDAVIVPADACGSSAILGFSQLQTKIIAVAENRTSMKVYPESLGIEAFRVESYLEALGAIVALRAGVALTSISPRLSSLTNYCDQPQQF
ncbi:DUF3326 domain-containing protein [Gloeocapsa sp. PCC 73106]|uniref:DUF3326 domain-containing protein n=1 Tax=Gloeocapsa sp. PCC 73106 TaxID=102232 RepID=UPI0002AC9FDC|nr:DUF3326 domain-containing protein [Gloeocapsa sp. PCC 73106]ELR97713.1 Protein of unknown function (DUF3326) [Gloeocapsa sp. PCC 73106]